MSQRKSAKPGNRLVWRITAEAPLGEFVDPDVHPAPRPAQGDPEASDWAMPSFDLKHGAEISKEPEPPTICSTNWSPRRSRAIRPDGADSGHSLPNRTSLH